MSSDLAERRGWLAYLVGAFVALAYIIIFVWRGSVSGVRDIILWSIFLFADMLVIVYMGRLLWKERYWYSLKA